jgi:5-methylcytosine-specific restriction protein A
VHRTFLITWNPRIYAWSDLTRDVARLRRAGRLHTDWSCARSKQIRKGDRLFLLRQGMEPRGIVASGWATSDWYEGPGWRRAGVPCNYVDLALDVLLDPAREPILPRDALSHGVLARMYWNTQVSGIRIPDPVACELEKAWRPFGRRRYRRATRRAKRAAASSRRSSEEANEIRR